MPLSIRLLRKSPGYVVTVVLTLALGIGANAAIFTVVNALLLRPLPVRDADRLVVLRVAANARQQGAAFPFSVAAFETVRDGNRSLSEIAAFVAEGMTLTGAGDPMQLSVERVSPGFFEVLGVQPVVGRAFRAQEGEPGAEPVVVLSQGLWERRFGSDASLVGRVITLAGAPYTVIGIMPRGFAIPREDIDAWITRVSLYSGMTQDQIRNGAGFLSAIGRVRAGFSIEQADAEAFGLGARYRQEHRGSPDANPDTRLEVIGLRENLVSDVRSSVLILVGAVGLVLLIACANVASLALARASARAREMAVRSALGAGRGDLVRQLLAESLALSVTGAALGLAFAEWGVSALSSVSGLGLPGFAVIRVDWTVLAFCAALAGVTAVLFGVVPALHASRPNLIGVLREGGHGAIGGSGRRRARAMLVAGQIALSMALLVSAGLLLRSFREVERVSPGFDARNALTMRVSLPAARYPDDARRSSFVRETLARFEALPGVRSAAASLSIPMGIGVMAPFLAEGQATVPIPQRPLAEWKAITPGYFATMGIPLVRGRAFTWGDGANAPRRVIVSESLARRYFGENDAVGRRIIYARREVTAEIVGVAADVRNRGLEAESAMIFYTPYPQFAWPNIALTIRTAGDPRPLENAARAQVFAADRDLPVTGLQTLEDAVAGSLDQRRQMLWLIGGFAAVALALALIGLYGAMSYAVTQWTTEIGLRQAIGAARADILRMVLAEGLRVSAIGVAAGMVASWGATRLVAGMLFHVRPGDPATFALVVALLTVVAIAASWLPAWRATRVDPLTALRGR